MGKHESTLGAIFRRPPAKTISWKDVVSVLVHCGAEITEGEGSRVRISLNGVKAVFHRPHPGNEIRTRTIKDLRIFLETAGVTP